MTLIFMGKRAVRQESACAASVQDLPLPRIYSWTSCDRFCDHGLVRVVRDLTVKKYFGAGLTLPMTYFFFAVCEGHKLSVLLLPPLVHVHRFLVYLGATFMRRYWILRFSFCGKRKFSSITLNLCIICSCLFISTNSRSPRKKRVGGVR